MIRGGGSSSYPLFLLKDVQRDLSTLISTFELSSCYVLGKQLDWKKRGDSIWYTWSISCWAGTVPITLHVLTHLILWEELYYYPHFIEELGTQIKNLG